MKKHPLLTKLAALAVIILLLVFGLGLVEDVVHDRQRYRSLTAQNVSSSLSGAQTLVGPLIHSACMESWDKATGTGKDRRITQEQREFFLTAMPDEVKIQSHVAMQERARGLHKVNTYAIKAHIEVQWTSLVALQPQTTVKGSRMHCGAPILMVAVGDARGIRSAQLTLAGQPPVSFKPGTFHPIYSRGVHATLPEGAQSSPDGVVAAVDLELVGTERLAFVPLGKSVEVQMASSWPHPSFAGRFLPAESSIQDNGFTAQWRLSSLNTTAQSAIADGKKICDIAAPDSDGITAAVDSTSTNDCADSFSVAFVDPVNPYTLSDRATKYGLLFIVLTFVAVGLFELMKNLRVHPVQYLLVGSALCSFFLLLVSLAEHLPFAAAYAIAATACVALLAYYASHILGSLARGLPFGAGIALLYSLLYVLLQLEQTALVVGAVALFLVLSTIMVLTRKVNWYRALDASQHSGSPPLGAA